MQDVVGTRPSKWCAGCHDHAVFFNGRFDQPIREQIDTPEAQAGLGCTSCHAITRVNSTMGQGDFVVEYPPLHDLAASDNPILQFAARLAALPRPEAASRNVPQAVSSRADAGVLRVVPQSAPRRARQRVSVVPRIQRLRQLAGVGRVGRRRAIVLLPAEAAAVRRLPHAAREGERSGGEERHGALASLRRGEYGAAVRQRRPRAARRRADVPARRTNLGRRLRHRARGRRRPRRQEVAAASAPSRGLQARSQWAKNR